MATTGKGELPRLECIGVRTDRVVEANGEGIAQIARLLETHLAEHGEELRAGDVVVVSGKVCSVAEGLVLRSADIAASDAAKAIAAKAQMPEGFVQQVLDDADEVLGVLPHVITTLRRGVLIANAGVDQSNVDPAHGDLVALPRDPDATALALMRLLRARYGVPVGVIVADSVVHALRRGTAGCALGVAGLHAVSSELGRSDLFGRAMRITSRAVADNICSAALLLMGETDERIPMVVVRGSRAQMLDDREAETATTGEAVIPRAECIYMGDAMVPNPRTQEYLRTVFAENK